MVHAAGLVGGIQANMANPILFLERNLSIGRNIIMASYEAGVRHFINLASTCMYPCAAQNPLKEDMILTGELEPTNEGYALAKIVATRLCQYIRCKDKQPNIRRSFPAIYLDAMTNLTPQTSLTPCHYYKVHQAKLHSEKVWKFGETALQASLCMRVIYLMQFCELLRT